MYSVTLQNFASIPREHDNFADAVKQARELGFESCVWFYSGHDGAHLVASYSPLYGFKVHNRELAGMEPGLTLADAIAINGRPVTKG